MKNKTQTDIVIVWLFYNKWYYYFGFFETIWIKPFCCFIKTQHFSFWFFSFLVFRLSKGKNINHFLSEDTMMYKKSIFFSWFVHKNMKKSPLKLGYCRKFEVFYQYQPGCPKGPFPVEIQIWQSETPLLILLDLAHSLHRIQSFFSCSLLGGIQARTCTWMQTKLS